MKPAPNTTQQKAILALARKQGLLRARDVAALGLPTVALSRLKQAGKLEQVARGLYAPTGRKPGEQGSLAEVALRVPRGVVCLLSALRVHEIGTQAPFEVWLALPQGTATPKCDWPQLHIVRLSGEAMTAGVEHIKIDGVAVPVFSAAKTITDCFKFRNKIGLDVAMEALREGWRERRVTMDELWRYATVNRVANVMRPYLESLGA